MDNLKLLKLRLSDKLDELEKTKETQLRYDALENPTKALKHYKDKLVFFNEGKSSLARMIDKPKDEDERADYEMLTDFYLTSYPELELNLLRIIHILEKKNIERRHK
jgi:hypothetical protein